MKQTWKRKELISNDDIWNAVIRVICDYDFPTESKIENELYIVFQYYSELESGGHESLFTWFSDYIEEVGITNYLNELTGILVKIGAGDYAKIANTYGEEMWRLYKALEKDEMEEDNFYRVIGKADKEYYNHNGSLGELLETYFVKIHTDLIEVIDA